MFYKQQKLIFFLSLGFFSMTFTINNSRSRGVYRTSTPHQLSVHQLSENDYYIRLKKESDRLIDLWKKLKWPISRKERELKRWKVRTMPLGRDAINDDGEDSRKMQIWRAAYVKLQRYARLRF